MACYYVNDEEVGKVLISECYSTVHSNDIEDCSCTSYRNFEKVRYNETCKKLKDSAKTLQAANKELMSEIEVLKFKLEKYL